MGSPGTLRPCSDDGRCCERLASQPRDFWSADVPSWRNTSERLPCHPCTMRDERLDNKHVNVSLIISLIVIIFYCRLMKDFVKYDSVHQFINVYCSLQGERERKRYESPDCYWSVKLKRMNANSKFIVYFLYSPRIRIKTEKFILRNIKKTQNVQSHHRADTPKKMTHSHVKLNERTIANELAVRFGII